MTKFNRLYNKRIFPAIAVTLVLLFIALVINAQNSNQTPQEKDHTDAVIGLMGSLIVFVLGYAVVTKRKVEADRQKLLEMTVAKVSEHSAALDRLTLVVEQVAKSVDRIGKKTDEHEEFINRIDVFHSVNHPGQSIKGE